MLVGGEWVDARSGETFETVDPFTARSWATLPRAGPEDVDAAVAAARAAFDDGPWRRAPGRERARLLRRLAELVAERALEIATVEVTDNGKLLREMEQQLRGLPDYLHYWAGAADKIGGETIPGPTEDCLIYTRREPVGVVAAITPWNSPRPCSPECTPTWRSRARRSSARCCRCCPSRTRPRRSGGLGRENGLEALHEYTEHKTVWVELGGATRDPFKLG